MKTPPMRLRETALTLAIMVTFSGTRALGAVGLTVSPSAISNTYSGMITVQITGLANGETVTLQKYLDMNGDGRLDSADWLMQNLSLTDGFVPRIGGATNYGMPYDITGTNGAITALLNYCRPMDNNDRFVGRYFFRVSGPSGTATNSLLITNFPYPQLVRGTVRASGTNVPSAVVVFLDENGVLFAGTVASTNGNYTNRLAPGTYQVLAFRPGYVSEFTNAVPVTLTNGATIVTNLTLVPATRLISGRLVDAANTNIGLPGVFIVAGSINEQQAVIAATDSNGYSTMPVGPNYWVIQPSAAALATMGYVGLDEESLPIIDTTSGNFTNGLLTVPKADALVYGSIRTTTGVPLAGIRFAGDDENDQYETDATSDTNGVYAAPMLGGRCWWFGVDSYDVNPILTNYVVTAGTNICLGPNQAVKVDFLAAPRTGTISGWVKDQTNAPVAYVGVYAWAVIGTNEFSLYGETDEEGYFWFPAADGTWHVGVSCLDLQERGYECVSEQTVDVPPANAVVNFTVSPVGPLQITTTNLPSGQVGVYYSARLEATGGQQPYNWSLAPGSAPLPSGLSLWQDGYISGTPSASGTFNFTVRVTDQQSRQAERGLAITIAPAVPPQIITTSLPTGQVGVAYSTWLSATGGQPPYTWSLAPGSGPLPPGLTLYSSGNIAGTPSSSGTFNFTVRVTDQWSSYAERALSITVVPAPQPLQILTTSLPGGVVGQSYSAQLLATNGAPPYLWGLSSGTLPPGLSLYTDGRIVGTPLTNGTFNFTVGVVDSAFSSAWTGLSITVALPPLQVPVLSAPERTPEGYLQLRFNTVAGATYTLLASTNLVNWVPVITFTGSGGPVTINDPTTSGPVRFYRIRAQR